jgi:hypothetical protein
MKRITISLPDRVAAALEREARRRREPVSQFARKAIEASLGPADEKRVLKFAGIVSDETIKAADFEEHLKAAWSKKEL